MEAASKLYEQWSQKHASYLLQAVFGREGVCYRVDWAADEVAALVVSSAAFGCVPDLLWANQAFIQVGWWL